MRKWLGVFTALCLVIPTVAVAAPSWQVDLDSRVAALEGQVADLLVRVGELEASSDTTTTTVPPGSTTTVPTTTTAPATTTSQPTTTTSGPEPTTSTLAPTTTSPTTTTTSIPTTTTTAATTTTTAPGTEEINLQGDWAIPGHSELSNFVVKGNGHQILISGTVDWDDFTIDNVDRIMFHNGAGPSELTNGVVSNSGTTGVLGSYPLHWHLNGDTTRGTLVENVDVVNGRNHAFVPHGSHGITFIDSDAFGVVGPAYWWDPPGTNNCTTLDRFCTDDNSNDIIIDGAHVEGVTIPPGSNPEFRIRNSAYVLGAGSGNVIRNSHAENIRGEVDCSAYHWPEQANMNSGGTVWVFEDNTGSSDCHGIFVWQNDDNVHVVKNFTGPGGIDHGAYRNIYHYINPVVPYFEVHALNWPGVTGGSIGRVIIQDHTLPDPDPVVFQDVAVGSVVVQDGDDHPGIFHFNNTGLTCGDVTFNGAHLDTVIQVDGTEC